MLWRPFVAAALFLFPISAIADEKGDALVQGWIARIPEIMPITVETTTTYKLGKWTATYKSRITHTPNYDYSTGEPYQRDGEDPYELYNDPLRENFEPLSYNGAADRLGIGSKGATG